MVSERDVALRCSERPVFAATQDRAMVMQCFALFHIPVRINKCCNCLGVTCFS
jgi:hypothetical protein